MASILNYFNPEKGLLPYPTGPLSAVMPSSTIEEANKAVGHILDEETKAGEHPKTPQRQRYDIFTATEKANIAKCAMEIGVTKAIRKLEKKYSGRRLKESTIREWVKRYKAELKNKRKKEDVNPIIELPEKNRGRPLLMGKELDYQVKTYILALRENGAVINSAIVKACAIGVVKKHDANLLKCNGGHIEFSKFSAVSFLDRIGFVKRKSSTKAKVSVADFEEKKTQFLFDIKSIIDLEEISPELVINWDHTGIHYVPVSNWTMAKEGQKRIEIAGVEDKRQLTAVFAGSMSGSFLPPQIIYKGKTKKCLPDVEFPKSWHVTNTHNHWANENTTEDYIKFIFLPYVEKKRMELKTPSAAALVIFDRFKGQCTPRILSLLSTNNIHIAVVPGNCTDRLQPLDVSVNKSVKDFLRDKFQTWYSNKVCSNLDAGEDTFVDLRMSIVKNLGAHWLIDLYDHLSSKPDIIINGFRGSGILTEA